MPYNYYICNVTLENFDLSHLPVYLMDEEQLSLYATYMSTLGNRPDLFGTAEYPNASTLHEPTYYDIPPEAMENETFAAMIAEAEKPVEEKSNGVSAILAVLLILAAGRGAAHFLVLKPKQGKKVPSDLDDFDLEDEEEYLTEDEEPNGDD